MTETSLSLLDRLNGEPAEEDWQKLVDVYTPLIRYWLRDQLRLQQDADDLVQEVLIIMMRKVPEFQHQQQTGSFRSWLKKITINCLRDFWRSKKAKPLGSGKTEIAQLLNQWEDPHSGLSQLWERQHNHYVMQHLLEKIRPDFTKKTWDAFRRVALDEESPDDVAVDLEMSVNAVFIAKSRVLSKLRQEGAGLIDV